MNIAYSIFVYIVWFLVMYFVILLLLFLRENKKKLFDYPKLDKNEPLPKVSVIVPAYNEENDIAKTVESLKKIDYPQELLEIIIINDGSTDKTSKVISAHAGKQIVFIDNKVNKGKAACLNQGIKVATGEFVACMDADSTCEKGILKKTVPYFKNKKIGVVTVTVEVRNPKSLLEKIVELEFILGLSLFLKIFSLLNCVYVTPGPFSIYRKRMMDEINGFDEKNLTEDLEIAYRIRKAGYKIDCCMAAKVKTTVPQSFKSFYKQRRRWYTGALHTIWQHRDIAMRKRYGLFGYFITYNYAIIFLGVTLFIITIFLSVQNWLKDILFYRFTNFNFFQHMQWPEIDFLGISIFYILGITGFLTTIVILTLGTRAAQKSLNKRRMGGIGYLFLFFLYQIFWISSIYHFLMGKKVKWR